MKSAYEQVRAFHKAFNLYSPAHPILIRDELVALRIRLIDEELTEYQAAVNNEDLVEIADALADLAYVVIGTAVTHGLTRFDEIFNEVHRSNMSKLGPDGNPLMRADGKVLKSSLFTPPSLRPLIHD